MQRLLAVLLVIIMVGAACGSSDPDVPVVAGDDTPDDTNGGEDAPGTEDPPDAEATPTPEPAAAPEPDVPTGPIGDLEALATDVEHQPVQNSEFTLVAGTAAVAVGDLARTNDTGFGEIKYFEGSFTRLDANTTFEVLELIDDPGAPTVRARLDVGRTWHRVKDLSGTDGSFVIETAVGSAAVRGTAFSVICIEPTSCSFVVAEGTVVVTPNEGDEIVLEAGEGVLVSSEDLNPQTDELDNTFTLGIAPDGIVGDDWVIENDLLDQERGAFQQLPLLAPGGAPASLIGDYALTIDGYELPGAHRIDLLCEGLGYCTLGWGNDTPEPPRPVPMWNGTDYYSESEFEGPLTKPVYDSDGQFVEFQETCTVRRFLTWRWEVLATETVGGVVVATEIRRTETNRGEILDDPNGECEAWDFTNVATGRRIGP